MNILYVILVVLCLLGGLSPMATATNTTEMIGENMEALGNQQQGDDQQDQSIILAINTWTATLLNVEIAKQVIKANYPHINVRVEKYGATFDTVNYMLNNRREPIVFFEVWPAAISRTIETIRKTRTFPLLAEQLGVLELGELGVVGRIGFYVPDYVIRRYPEASSWEFYKEPTTAELFATPETYPRGRFLTGDPTWWHLHTVILHNLEIPFDVVYAGNESAQVDILHEAASNQENIFMYWWVPTAVAAQYNLRQVEFPEITDECRTVLDSDDSFYSCDYPPDVTIKLITTSVQERFPELMPFLRAFTITNDDQLSLLPRVVFDRETVQDVCADWIEANNERVDMWLAGESGTTPMTSSKSAAAGFVRVNILLSVCVSVVLLRL